MIARSTLVAEVHSPTTLYNSISDETSVAGMLRASDLNVTQTEPEDNIRVSFDATPTVESNKTSISFNGVLAQVLLQVS